MQITIDTPEKLKSALPYGALEEIMATTKLSPSTVKNFKNKKVIAAAKAIIEREYNNPKTI